MSAEQQYRRPIYIPPWDGRVFVNQTPDHTSDPGLKRLAQPQVEGEEMGDLTDEIPTEVLGEEELIDVSMSPSMISGVTQGEVSNLHTNTKSPQDLFLPEGGFSVVSPDYLSRVGRADRAEEGY